MINRRTFLKTTAASAALAFTTGCSNLFNSHPEFETAADNAGLALVSIQSELAKDYQATFQNIAAIGYKKIEFFNFGQYFHGHSTDEVNSIMKNTGLNPISSLVHFPTIRQPDQMDHLIELTNAVNIKYLVCGFVLPEDRVTIDKYKALFHHLNKVGEKCKRAGIQFAHHNHNFEFTPTDGHIPYDVLLAETDPNLVAMEMDVYWVKSAGADPIKYFEKYPNRFPLIHLKDMNEAGQMTSLGQGTIDFPTIIRAAKKAGAKHFFAEHDNPENPLQFAKESCDYLKTIPI